jgi:hypothetical protein
MKTSNVLCCVESTVLQLFFFFIVGVFGLPLAIAGLAADSMCQPCVCSYTYPRPSTSRKTCVASARLLSWGRCAA